MVRDLEIERLINYIKGLGLKVSFSSKKNDCSAFWYLDNSEIVICKKGNSAKIDIVLSLIHELGHAKHSVWEKNRQLDTKLETAIDSVDEAEEEKVDAPKRHRKIVLDHEVASTKYWHEIYHETDMKFPIWKLEAQMEFDLWQYKIWYETGKDPKRMDRRKKLREIYVKHKNKA